MTHNPRSCLYSLSQNFWTSPSQYYLYCVLDWRHLLLGILFPCALEPLLKHRVLWLVQHLYFKAEASTNFGILAKCQLGFGSFNWAFMSSHFLLSSKSCSECFCCCCFCWSCCCRSPAGTTTSTTSPQGTPSTLESSRAAALLASFNKYLLMICNVNSKSYCISQELA